MAYDTPTAAELKTRHVAFAAVDDGWIDAVIAESLRDVGLHWSEVDYKPAIIHLSAHRLAMEGALTPAGLVPVGVSTGQIKSESMGDASVTYESAAAGSGGKSSSEYAKTPYGVLYLRLLRSNVGGPIVV